MEVVHALGICLSQGAQMMINELKTEALKERHWRSIIKQLSIKATMTDLTLGHLWDSDLTTHKAALQEILTTAQGEMALEVFLRQVGAMSMELTFMDICTSRALKIYY